MTATIQPVDSLDRMLGLADRWLYEMTADQRAAFARRQDAEALELLEQAVLMRTDPDGRRVYKQLGYEPICIPRVKAAIAAGHRNPHEAEAAGMTLPPLCGRCPQEMFDAATEFDVFYGGAAGGGKTMALIMLAVRLARRWPGFRALFLRETFDDLDENVFPVLRAIDYASVIGGKWNAGRKELNIVHPEGMPLPPTGQSAIRFRYMENLDDLARRQGGGYQLVCMDERTLLPPGTADGLMDRLRSVGGIPVVGLRSTGNPGGRAHGELKKGYVRPTRHGTRLVRVKTADGKDGYLRRYIPAKAPDNPYLNDDYFTVTLGSIKDPARRRAMQDGDWDVFAGMYFAEWNRERHVVPRDATVIAESWPRYAGIDYGRAAPFAYLRGAVDGDGRLWLYAELYKAGVGEREQAQLISKNEKAMRETVVHRAGDPAMFAKVNDADTIADTYRKHGVVMDKADNARVIGWTRVHTYLGDGPACPHHSRLGWQLCPMLHVLEATCPDLERTLPDLPFDKHNVEDLDTKAEDHAADALRYLVMRIEDRQRGRARTSGAAQREAHASSVG